MSRCDVDALDRLVAGELGGDEIASLRRHLSACAECTRELVQLRNDQRLFRMRAAELAVAPPEYERVRQRARAVVISSCRDRWMPSVALVLSTFTLGALLLGAHPSPVSGSLPSTGATSSMSPDSGSSEETTESCETAAIQSSPAPAPVSVAPHASFAISIAGDADTCRADAPTTCEPL